MKVRNIMFTGFMAAILSATGAHAAISVASQGYVDSKVGDVATSVSTLSTTVADTYQTKTDAASQHQTLQNAIDSKVAQAAYDVKMEALDAMDDTFATKASVGELPGEATATTIVGYIQEKTAGIATDAALEQLTNRVTTAEGEIDALQVLTGENGQIAADIAAALKAGDDAQKDIDELNTVLTTNDTVAKANAAAVKSDVDAALALKASQADLDAAEGKITALEGQLGEDGVTTQAIAAAKSAADAAQDAADAAQGDVDAVEKLLTDNGTVAKANAAQTAEQVGSAIDTKITALDLANTYDTKGAAAAVEAKLKLLATAEVPEACLTGTDGSNICVLTMTSTGEFAWTPLTAPAE